MGLVSHNLIITDGSETRKSRCGRSGVKIRNIKIFKISMNVLVPLVMDQSITILNVGYGTGTPGR